MTPGDHRKECCKDEKNLSEVVKMRDDLMFRRCSVCQCRHFELSVDPVHFNFRGAAAH